MNPTKRRLILSVLGTGLLMFSMATGALGRAESNEQQFRLYGTALDALDPENPDNEAVQFNTANPTGSPVLMFRPVKETVVELDNQLEFKYFMQNRNCGAGSPRITLGVDNTNDGRADFFLHGHVQPDFFCPVQNQWVFQDLTDNAPRWETTGPAPAPLPLYSPWSAVETAFGGLPVVEGFLVEDSQVFKLDNRGLAYYDLVTIGNHTYTDHSDAARCENRECPEYTFE